MDIVRVRGRVVHDVQAYFVTPLAHERGAREADVRAAGARFDLVVDGHPVAVDLAADTEAHTSRRYTGPFAEASAWDPGFPFATPATAPDIAALSIALRAGDEVEVWGRVAGTRRAPAAYREAPRELPSRLVARAIDVPVRPASLVPERRGALLAVLGALVASGFVPMGSISPYYRFWSFVVLAIVLGATHWKIVPNAVTRAGRYESLSSLGLSCFGVLLFLFTLVPMIEDAPRWLAYASAAVFGGAPIVMLLARMRRLQNLCTVARRVDASATSGIVRAVEGRKFETTGEVGPDDTLHVVCDTEERTVQLAGVVWDCWSHGGPRPGMRVLVGRDALYASWQDPRAELDHIRRWDRACTRLIVPVSAVLGVVAFLAYTAPRL